MEKHAAKISASINKINSDSTDFALKQFKTGAKVGRLKPFSTGLSAFISSFFNNENKYILKNRIINSYLISFSEFVKYLKLLKLNKRF